MTTKLNVLIIGGGVYVCGRGTKEYGTILPALFKQKLTGLVADITICTTGIKSSLAVEEKVQELNHHMGTDYKVNVGPKTDNSNFWKDSIDNTDKNTVVLICTPDHLHFEMSKYCINKCLNHLVVKPLTTTAKDAKTLIKMAQEKNIYGAVEFHKRFDRSNLYLKTNLEKIGTPLYFIIEYSQKRMVPSIHFKSWVHETNIFQYLGVHYADIIYFCTKATPKRVSAKAFGKTLKKRNGVDVDDSIIANIIWEKDGKEFHSSFHLNWVDSELGTAMSDQKIKVIGTDGRIEADQKDRGLQFTTEFANETPNPDFCKFYDSPTGLIPEGYGIQSVCTFIEDSINLTNNKVSLKSLNSLRPSFESSYISSLIIEYVNSSLKKNGEWLDINNEDFL